MDELELLHKIEVLQEMSEALKESVPGMFAGAVKPVNELMDGVLDVMMSLFDAVVELQETQH